MLAPECLIKWDGAAGAILLGAIPLAIALTIATLLLYRWAIGRAMRTATPQAAQFPETASSSPPSHPLKITVVDQGKLAKQTAPGLAANLGAMQRLSVVYVLAGVVHAAIATIIIFLLENIQFSPVRVLVWGYIFAWPLVAGLMMTYAMTRRLQVLLAGAYFGLLLLLEIVAEVFNLRYQPAFGELFKLWVITMGPPTVVIVLLANRAWRSVGLTALFVSIVLVAAYLLSFQLLGCLVLTTRNATLLASMNYLLFAMVFVCTMFAWLLLKRGARRYQTKRASDQMLLLDNWWLLVTGIEILFVMGQAVVPSFSLLLAFAGYKLVRKLGLQYLVRTRSQQAPQSMLLLRVFGHSVRVRSLADQVGQLWRHEGPINMIGGTDLATSLLEPDELMAFWSGKLRERFIAGPADLAARLESMDEKPDPDGRYRINEFFCHDDTWRATVHALAQRSSVVLMDLRGFGKENRGCEFELAMLLAEIPLARVVLLIDRATATESLKTLLHSMWEKLPSSSLNRDLTKPELYLFRSEDSSNAGQMSLALAARCMQILEQPGAPQVA